VFLQCYSVRSNLCWLSVGIALHDGRSIANFILDHCETIGRPISNVELQKILYFCHAWTLVETNHPLVKHLFEAWEYGPVLPYLWREFTAFGKAPITARAQRLNPMTGKREIATYNLDVDIQTFLRKVIEFYSRIDAFDLVELSHVAGGPWHNVWNHLGEVNPGMKIDHSDINKFYAGARRPFS
jgi:uncharacterized phage-associated protein